ncbi:HlyD family secretion protein [Sphingomonas albertensis]|uniref:HlyD family secretion protein n=1 Tax=Sphingomonas albertensis TaxID=2762591 RepID=A0ABR7AJI1_9SPHN|nr:HlyD family secretion protein [Sphingomonas albertensis]MBC3940614.1 HlyD family secretion protein [Sphingomonas albertensis]
MDAMTTQPEAASKKSRRLPVPTARTAIACLIAIAIAIAGALWITSAPSSETTDDAYVAADATSLAPKVRGLVAAVLVRDNQTVKAGDALVRIDPEEFTAKVEAAKASLANAVAGLAAARAGLVSLDAEQTLSSAQTVATRTAIRSADAQSSRAEADRRRYDVLVLSGAVARRDADAYTAKAVSAEQDAARARAMLVVAGATEGVTRAKREGLMAAVETARAGVASAQAALALAEQDLRHTTIYASIDGTVGNRQVRVGDYVQPGTRLLTLVPLHALYVTANFKETQTARMVPGQPVVVEADAVPGVKLRGRVDSFAPGSGSSFSLLPFEPGTGNFTKIVQRVGVRVRFDPGQSDVGRLRPGLSVMARVRLE